MRSKLLKECKTKKDKEDRQKYLLEHKFIFELLSGILKEELRLLDNESSSAKRYDDQSWPYKQADYNGCKRTYNEVLNLLDIGE